MQVFMFVQVSEVLLYSFSVSLQVWHAQNVNKNADVGQTRPISYELLDFTIWY